MKAFFASAVNAPRIMSPAFGPGVHVLEICDTDADVAISGHWLVREMELIGRAANIGAGATDRHGVRGHLGAAGHHRISDVAVRPASRQPRSLPGRTHVNRRSTRTRYLQAELRPAD
jgi:hypothetical protein